MIEKEKGQLTSRPLIMNFKDTKRHHYIKSLAVKMLERLANETARAKYPTVPYLAPRTYRDDTANSLTKCILSFLRIKGHQAERINSTGRIVDKRKSYTDVVGRSRTIGSYEWVYGTTTKGTADISATIAGHSVKVEVKVCRDQQSEAQRRYQEEVEKAGGIYVIARDFQEFYNWYNSNFGEGGYE